jgi:Protein kinase domain/CHAT domain
VRTVGPYEILGEVGRGGMAIVHRARHAGSGEIVALKELNGLAGLDAGARERFRRTAGLAGGLRHPNIVAVREVFEHDGTPFLASEYLERGSLRRVLRGLTAAQLTGAFEDVLAGLAQLERHAIVHRDLKPENLLVSTAGRVKITDFALAKVIGETAGITPTGSALGTPAYMAPEQATARPVDSRADLYALGCIAHEVVMGGVPFDDRAAPLAMLMRRVTEDAALPPEPPMWRGFAAWIARMLARVPADRPASAAAAWRELEAIVVALDGPRWREQAALPAPPDAPPAPPEASPARRRCPACGESNSVYVDFCRCGEYLRWVSTGSIPAIPPLEAADERSAPVPDARTITDEFPSYGWMPAGPAPEAAAPQAPEPPRAQAAQPPAEPAAPRLVRRTPHLDVSVAPPLARGTVFEVAVHADEGPARPGEEVEEILVKAPPTTTALDLDVWLVATHHFVVTDAPIRRIRLGLDEPRSERATFRLAVVAAPAADEEPLITASFSCNGRPSGRVSRAVPIAGGASAPPPEPAAAPALEVDLATVAPDLTIEIAAPERDGRRFDVRVDTPHLALDRRTEPWFLPVEAGELVTAAMARFFDRDATPRARLSSLRGAGLDFFDAAPQLFKDVYWRLVDEGRPPRNLFVVSDERSIPWELMIPSRRTATGTQEHEPLGVQLAIGRWHRQTGVSPRQRVPLASSVVVAPESARLEHAAAEAEFVCRNFAGNRVDPASFDNLDIELERGGADLLHFICHGEADEHEQVLLLEAPDRLYSQQLRAMPGLAKACRERRPFVFLNACELGRHGRGLSAASGFAKSFIDVDAACVVGTLWSVDDGTAHEVAIAFYEEVLGGPATPFAEVLRRIRARAYRTQGEDSWAAYCFYGDPAARAA